MDDDREERLRAVLEAVLNASPETLPDEVRRCFLLRFAQGFEESEIAVLMKIPLEMVRMHLHQVRRWLLSKETA
jgi:DNA-directed RNA polymerase specialized sigma24 family protein